MTRVRQRPGTRAAPARPADPERLTPEGRRALAAGLVLATLLYAFPLTRFVFGYLGILAHELGHAAAAWAFGYPAIPAFDFLYGGGLTTHFGRSWILQGAIVAVLFALLWSRRGQRGTLRVLVPLVGTYLVAAFTPLHEVLATAAGHAAELVLAGVFLYRAMRGSPLTHRVERPLYATMGFFLIFGAFSLAGRLCASASFRRLYAQGKGGCLRHDFQILADDYLGVGVRTVGALFLLCCALTLLLSWLAYRHRRRWTALLAVCLAGEGFSSRRRGTG